jgi:hypothetical protein
MDIIGLITLLVVALIFLVYFLWETSITVRGFVVNGWILFRTWLDNKLDL